MRKEKMHKETKGKLLATGAEAIIIKKGNTLIKKRIKKGYRIAEIDEKLRKHRTRAEAKLIEKASKIIPTSKIISKNENEKELVLNYIPGKKLAETLDGAKSSVRIMNKIGQIIGKIHDRHIIHGDLTTSNIIYNPKTSKIALIDFGLGFNSQRDEDKAVDLHVFKEALEARHPTNYERFYRSFLRGYNKSKGSKSTLKQLEKVEMRGRYKAQY